MVKINITKGMHLDSSEMLVVKVLDHPIYMLDNLANSHMLSNTFLRQKLCLKVPLPIDVYTREVFKICFYITNLL